MAILTCTPAQLATTYSAASSGDTIYVDSGTSSASYTLAKRCRIIGGGVGSGQTPGTTTLSGGLVIHPTLTNADQLRVSGFTLSGGGSGAWDPTIELGQRESPPYYPNPMPTNIRIDHCTILNTTSGSAYAFTSYDNCFACIDNCLIGTSANPVNRVLWYQAWDGDQNIWSTAPKNIWSSGGAQNIFFEDNRFYIRSDARVCTHNVGGRTVWRYNTISAAAGMQAWIDIHGCQGWPSAFGVEVYGNYCIAGGGTILDTRSGENRCFWNVGDMTNTAQNYWGSLMTCPAEVPNEQMIHDTYHWNNRRTLTGALAYAYTGTVRTAVCGSRGNRPTAGVDYFDEATSPAVTSGLLANRPASPTVGQGYWATDQTSGLTNLTNYVGDKATYPSRLAITGTLYFCHSAGTWTQTYTPYTYPHPFREEGSSPPVGTPVLSVR